MARRGTVERPAGLRYQEDVLSLPEEAALVRRFESTAFEPVVLAGHTARRTVCHYGYTYDFDSWRLATAETTAGSVVVGVSVGGDVPDRARHARP